MCTGNHRDQKKPIIYSGAEGTDGYESPLSGTEDQTFAKQQELLIAEHFSSSLNYFFPGL